MHYVHACYAIGHTWFSRKENNAYLTPNHMIDYLFIFYMDGIVNLLEAFKLWDGASRWWIVLIRMTYYYGLLILLSNTYNHPLLGCALLML